MSERKNRRKLRFLAWQGDDINKNERQLRHAVYVYKMHEAKESIVLTNTQKTWHDSRAGATRCDDCTVHRKQ